MILITRIGVVGVTKQRGQKNKKDKKKERKQSRQKTNRTENKKDRKQIGCVHSPVSISTHSLDSLVTLFLSMVQLLLLLPRKLSSSW